MTIDTENACAILCGHDGTYNVVAAHPALCDHRLHRQLTHSHGIAVAQERLSQDGQ